MGQAASLIVGQAASLPFFDRHGFMMELRSPKLAASPTVQGMRDARHALPVVRACHPIDAKKAERPVSAGRCVQTILWGTGRGRSTFSRGCVLLPLSFVIQASVIH
jgi:hypothetical protein